MSAESAEREEMNKACPNCQIGKLKETYITNFFGNAIGKLIYCMYCGWQVKKYDVEDDL